MSPIFLFFGFLVLIGVLGYLGWLQQKKRREAFMAIAAQHGFEYLPEKDRRAVRQYEFVDLIRRGSDRYIYNRLRGNWQDRPVESFDFHYETESRDSKGNRTTHHHHGSAFLLMLPGAFPELRIYRESFFQKIAQALGFDDIDFESAEFSKRYAVKSRDRKFAYDFCNARMIDFLLDESDLNIEVEGTWLVLAFSKTISPEKWEQNFQRLCTLYRLMPDYLFEEPRNLPHES